MGLFASSTKNLIALRVTGTIMLKIYKSQGSAN